MSEWLLFNANSAIFQLYYGENKLIFNEKFNSLLHVYWEQESSDQFLHILLLQAKLLYFHPSETNKKLKNIL